MVLARADISLTVVIDIVSIVWYYKLQSSTLAKPNKPTNDNPDDWEEIEPTYTPGSTNSLYTCCKTIFCDGTFSYSMVSLSSSYEAAKEAYNKAIAAQSLAKDANEKIDNLKIGTRNLASIKDSIASYRVYYNKTYPCYIDNTSRIIKLISASKDEEFTLTVYNNTTISLGWFDENKNCISCPDSNISVSSNWNKTYKAPENTCYVSVSWERSSGDNYVKLEKGNQSTDYTVPQEDVDDNIVESTKRSENYAYSLVSNMQGSVEEFKKEVTTTYAKSETLENYATVETMNTAISKSAENIRLDFDTTVKKSTENGENIDEIKKYIDFNDGNIILGSSENDIILAIENDKLGFYNSDYKKSTTNRNLIINSDNGYLDSLYVSNITTTPTYSNDNGWRKISFSKSNQLKNEIVQSNFIKIYGTGYYTFSILCKTDATSLTTNVDFWGNTSSTTNKSNIVSATVTQQSTGLYKISATYNVQIKGEIRIVDLANFTTVGATYVSFRYPKLEKGNTVSNWCAAPEDSSLGYYTGSTFNIKDGNIIESLKIGKFAFVPRVNGSIDFKKVGK